MFDKLCLWSLAIFLLLTGLFAVTNFQITWGPQILGFAALVAGVILTIRAVRGGP